MTLSPPITEDDIEDYIADRLDDNRRQAVDHFLRANPQRQAEVEDLIVQQDALRKMGADLLEEPVPERFLRLLMDDRVEPDEAASQAPGRLPGKDRDVGSGG